jgi:hypothetical protein
MASTATAIYSHVIMEMAVIFFALLAPVVIVAVMLIGRFMIDDSQHAQSLTPGPLPIPIPAFLLKGKEGSDLILALWGRTAVGVGREGESGLNSLLRIKGRSISDRRAGPRSSRSGIARYCLIIMPHR